MRGRVEHEASRDQQLRLSPLEAQCGEEFVIEWPVQNRRMSTDLGRNMHVVLNHWQE
ncbi:hypothetical protein DAI22_06g022400 [Oryza sativa Japonica Group]|nr:hypothetical protein DAI22_06g022400 [Oryza sativa Japonica Group]